MHPLPASAVHLAAISRPPSGRPAPLFGQHNHEVLSDDLGYPEEQIDGLAAAGVLRTTIG
jgi:hypothetical protein